MADIILTVLSVTALLALVSALPPIAERLRLPLPVLLAAVGCALGILATFQVGEGARPIHDILATPIRVNISSDALLYVFLPTLLFETALAMDARRLLDDIWPIFLLAVVAVLVSTLVVGATLWSVSGVSFLVCLLLGAIVATTDPVAVIGVFRDLGAPRRLTTLVEGESLLNDAAAIAIFATLLDLLRGDVTNSWGWAVADFLIGFAGGIAFGYLTARFVCTVEPFLRHHRLAAITLTVALAYGTFIVADHYLHLSGVVAVVTAALVLGTLGRTRINPDTWDALVQIWEQLGFWANSLIFLLAAMLVPRLIAGIGWAEAAQLLALVAAALSARALVLYGLLPALSMAGLAGQVAGSYKLVILWGGLRGAVSLALALAVTEHPWLPEETRRFVAVLATGYVLITVFVNGTTLRPLIHLLGLDRLTPADQGLRDRTLALSLETIRERTGDIALDHGFTAETAKAVAAPYAERLRALEHTGSRQEVSETERLTIGLLTLASHEERLYLRYRRERLISSRILERLIAAAGWLHDGAKAGGIEGYEAAWRRQLGFSRRFRLALFLHRRLGIATPLAAILSDRFETLTIIRMALKVLVNFADRRLPPLLGVSVAARLGSLMGERLVAVESALDALRLQYPAYAGALQQRYLMRAALRLEEAGYRELLSESVIGQEVYNDLSRGLAQRWRDADRRPALDLGLSTDQLIAGVPMFAEIGPEPRAAIARLLRPRLAVPGDRIVSRGERGEAMYFISSGAVEVSIPGTPARLGSGDFFGELALITNQPRVADVTALGYCQLLVLLARDFRRLLDADARLAERIGGVAKERLGTSIQPAK